MEKIRVIAKDKINELPKTAGVYFFYQKIQNSPIYIGKAINIKDRVASHFKQPSYRDKLFISQVEKIGFIETGSEIEALILEANLIKKHQPKYNVIWKDDKNYFYVAFENNSQKLPYVYITHQTKKPGIKYVGPFVEGTALKKTLRFLRRVFPYYSVKKHPKTKCTYCHLGLCPRLFEARLASHSEAADLIAEYKKNIKKLVLVLQGKRSAVLKNMRREMKTASKENRFEDAAKIRDRIFALQQVMAHTHVINGTALAKNHTNIQTKNNINWELTRKRLQEISGIREPIIRMECYDISNIQGTLATGSMVVFINGSPDTNQYRKFKIKTLQTPNDIAMLKEVFARRLKHTEWKYPEIMLIDGGKAQLNAAVNSKGQIKEQFHRIVPRVMALAKGRQELFIEGQENPIPLKELPQEVYNLIKHLDDEAHRFAISYHKKLRNKNLLK